ncbi:unnamed protein product, partial [marine sediment metagenome]
MPEYGPIIVKGMVLPEDIYGEKAVSRGDSNTRLITLRNLTWEQSAIRVNVGEETGLSNDIIYQARLLHPVERILGTFKKGESFTVPVDPFRSALILICPDGNGGIGIKGCDYEIIQDIPDKPLRIKLVGLPGTRHSIKLDTGDKSFTGAELDGRKVSSLIKGRSLKINFPGEPLREPYHRKIADITPCNVPEDAEALYEATIFSTDNNALEIRSL